MRKILILFSVVLFQSCLGGYSKIGFDSLENVRVQSVSLLYADFDASVAISNGSGRELEVRGIEIQVENLEGISLSMDTPIVIPPGSNVLQIPARLEYNPASLLALLGKVGDSFTLRFALKLPGREIKLKKKVSGSELLSFINKTIK